MVYIPLLANSNGTINRTFYSATIMPSNDFFFSDSSFSATFGNNAVSFIAGSPATYQGFRFGGFVNKEYTYATDGVVVLGNLSYYNGNMLSVLTPINNGGGSTWSLFKKAINLNLGTVSLSAPDRYDISAAFPLPTPIIRNIHSNSPTADISQIFFTNTPSATKENVYMVDIDETTVTYYNAFKLETGLDYHTFDWGNQAMRYDGAYYMCGYDINILSLVIIVFTPTSFNPAGAFTYTKYSLSFDDAAIDVAIASGPAAVGQITMSPEGFLFGVYNPDSSLMAYVDINRDGLSFTKYTFTNSYDPAITLRSYFIDDNGDEYSLGVSSDPQYYKLSFTPNAIRQNPSPITLPCISPCIPLIQER